MSRVLGVVFAMIFVVGLALADEPEPQGHAFGHTCDSPSGVGDNPGAWIQDLKASEKFDGMNVRQVVDHEDVSQESVFELFEEYCGPG